MEVTQLELNAGEHVAHPVHGVLAFILCLLLIHSYDERLLDSFCPLVNQIAFRIYRVIVSNPKYPGFFELIFDECFCGLI